MNPGRFVAFVVALTILGSGCSIPKPDYSFAHVPPAASTDRLLPGEWVEIRWEEYPPALPWRIKMEATVAEDGTVSLVSNRVFRAAGKTVGEFRLEIQQYYAREFKSVEVMCGYPGAFYHIGGEVRYPGEKIFEDQTLTQAILGAGGFTPSANKKKVRVISRDGEWRVIDCSRMKGIIGGRNRQEDVKLLHRDYIYVPRVSKWPFW